MKVSAFHSVCHVFNKSANRFVLALCYICKLKFKFCEEIFLYVTFYKINLGTPFRLETLFVNIYFKRYLFDNFFFLFFESHDLQ